MIAGILSKIRCIVCGLAGIIVLSEESIIKGYALYRLKKYLSKNESK